MKSASRLLFWFKKQETKKEEAGFRCFFVDLLIQKPGIEHWILSFWTFEQSRNAFDLFITFATDTRFR